MGKSIKTIWKICEISSLSVWIFWENHMDFLGKSITNSPTETRLSRPISVLNSILCLPVRHFLYPLDYILKLSYFYSIINYKQKKEK